MIKNLNTNSLNFTSNTYRPYLTAYNSANPALGQFKYDFSTQDIMVYDGNNWQKLSNDAYIDFSPDIQNIINWARKKMQDDMKLMQQIEAFPALKKAYNNYELIRSLVQSFPITNEEENK